MIYYKSHWMADSKAKLNANQQSFLLLVRKSSVVNLIVLSYAEPEFHTGRLSTEFKSHL